MSPTARSRLERRLPEPAETPVSHLQLTPPTRQPTGKVDSNELSVSSPEPPFTQSKSESRAKFKTIVCPSDPLNSPRTYKKKIGRAIGLWANVIQAPDGLCPQSISVLRAAFKVFINNSSLNGLRTKATAPAASARSRGTASSWAVIKITGSGVPFIA